MAPARCARRAKSVLLWAVLSILLRQLALGVYIDRCRPDLVDADFGPRLVLLQRLLGETPGRPLMVVLGSSRALNGFAADMLPPPGADEQSSPMIFNLAMHAAGPFRELLNLRRLLHAGIRPKAVIIEVLPALLYSDGDAIQKTDYLEPGNLYRTDLDVCRRYVPAQARRYEWQWLLYTCFPCYSKRVHLLEDYASDWLPPDVSAALEDCKLTDRGWEPHTLRAGLTVSKAEEMTEQAYGPLLRFGAVNPTTDRVMRELLSLCRREGIEVTALLAMPESRRFRRMYAARTERAVHSYLNTLAAEYGTRFVDARDWIDHDEWFCDSHHLFPIGAEAFTAKFWQGFLKRVPTRDPGDPTERENIFARR